MGRIQAPKWVHGPKSETAILEIHKLLSDLRYLFRGSLWVILWLLIRNVCFVFISVPGTEILKPCKFLRYEPMSVFCSVSEMTFGKPLGHLKGWGAKKEGLVAQRTNHVIRGWNFPTFWQLGREAGMAGDRVQSPIVNGLVDCAFAMKPP